MWRITVIAFERRGNVADSSKQATCGFAQRSRFDVVAVNSGVMPKPEVLFSGSDYFADS